VDEKQQAVTREGVRKLYICATEITHAILGMVEHISRFSKDGTTFREGVGAVSLLSPFQVS
jgi:hypothetical protein